MKRNNMWMMAIALLLIVTMAVLGNIMVVGDHLANIPHFGWLSWIFYGLVAVLFIWAFVMPAVKLLISPEMPALSIDEETDIKKLKEFGKTLLSNCSYIPNKRERAKHIAEIQRRISMSGKNKEKLREVIETELSIRINGDEGSGVLGINKRIDLWAQRVLVTTAISQNSKLDSIIVLWSNFKMISDIANASGFRPNAKQIVKLYFNVLTTSLLSYAMSEGLSGMDDIHPFDFGTDSADDIVAVEEAGGDSGEGFTLIGILRKIRLPGIAVESLIDGASNALLTYRIGYITRAYIIEGHRTFIGKDNKRRIRREAIKESFKSMPRAIKNGSSQMSSTASSLLSTLYKNL